jgi:nitroreductase
VDLVDAIARRRMVRAFRPDPVDPATLDGLLDAARRAPSAGFTQGVELLALNGPAETARYWDTTLPAERRGGFPWPRLLDAPALVVVCADPAAYVARYAEPDKAGTGLGAGAERWAVPFWFVDAGMAAENLLLRATACGLGACLFGVFDHEPAVKAAFGIPERVRTVATVAVGHPDPAADRPSRSAAERPRRSFTEVVHRGHW